MGLGRFIVVAETDAEALALARRAYPRWHESFTHLHRLHNYTASHPRPPDFDGIAEVGQGVAGSPRTVRHSCASSSPRPAAIIASGNSRLAI